MAGEWKRTSLREAGVTLIDCGQWLSIRRDSPFPRMHTGCFQQTQCLFLSQQPPQKSRFSSLALTPPVTILIEISSLVHFQVTGVRKSGGDYLVEKLVDRAIGRSVPLEKDETRNERTRTWTESLSPEEHARFDQFIESLGERTTPIGTPLDEGRSEVVWRVGVMT